MAQGSIGLTEQLKPLLSTAKIFKNSNNPMGMLEAASSSNPQLQTVLNQMKALNGDPREAFIAGAKSKGYSEEQINEAITQLQQLWNTI